jgi:hypothetical protein
MKLVQTNAERGDNQAKKRTSTLFSLLWTTRFLHNSKQLCIEMSTKPTFHFISFKWDPYLEVSVEAQNTQAYQNRISATSHAL